LCEWAGVSEDLFARISTQIGGKPQQIRHIASIPQKNAMQDLTSQTDPPTQGPSPLEWGLIHSFRRVARSLFSLPPEEVHKTTTPDNEVPPVPPLHPDQKSTLKLSELVNAMWDHKLIPLSDSANSDMYARYRLLFGADPPEDIEPTPDQISAIKMLDDLKFIPGVDFSLFGPHGRRAMKKLTYAAQQWDPETQTYKRRDLPGPPDFDTWLRSWEVFK
jgi:hypothetical protein